MEDLYTPDSLRIAQSTEGIAAQTRIVEDLLTGKGLGTETAQSQLESYYRTFLNEHSNKAYQELTGIIGLNPEKLKPISEGGSAQLDIGDKTKLISYLLERNHDWISGISLGNEALDEGFKEQMLKEASLFHSLDEDEYEVEVTGPLIRIVFKTPSAYSRFADSMSVANTRGIFVPLPLKDENGKSWSSSSNTFINLISPGEGNENTYQHEMFHAVDQFRREQLQEILARNPDDPIVKENALNMEGEKNKRRMTDFFFDPSSVAQNLEALRNTAPEVYNYFVRVGLSSSSHRPRFSDLPEEFMKVFLSIQREVPAFLAEYFTSDLTDAQKQEIIDKLIQGYMPFGRVRWDDLKSKTRRDESGKLVVDESVIEKEWDNQLPLHKKVKKYFKKLMTGNFDIPADENVTKKEIEEDKMLSSYSQRRDVYSADLQLLIDYFLNPGGEGFEILDKMRRNLGDVIDTYLDLASLRGNKYQALIEISMVPLSHWRIYEKRQNDLENRRGQHKLLYSVR